jgi:hypothetical protein
MLRDSERQIAVFESSILPRARQGVDLAQAAYASDRGGFAGILAAQGSLLDVRLLLARMKVEREKSLAALESSAAIDAGGARP